MSTHKELSERYAEVDNFNLFDKFMKQTPGRKTLHPTQEKQPVQYMDLDPVQSFIRMDRCGPNPNPEWCYILKSNLCHYKN